MWPNENFCIYRNSPSSLFETIIYKTEFPVPLGTESMGTAGVKGFVTFLLIDWVIKP